MRRLTSTAVRFCHAQLLETTAKRNISVCSKLAGSMELPTVIKKLHGLASPSLAGSWDNVGLLVEPSSPHMVETIMLTNDLTPEVLQEAVATHANMILAYHPPIFSPLKRLTQASWKEKIVVGCVENRIAVYSPHTSYDCVQGGVNDWLLSCFDCVSVEPVEQHTECPGAANSVEFCLAEEHYPALVDRIAGEQDITIVNAGHRNGVQVVHLQCGASSLPSLVHMLQQAAATKLQLTTLAKVPRVGYGMGRVGRLREPVSIPRAVEIVKQHLGLKHVRLATAPGMSDVSSVAVCAGSGSSVLHGVTADMYVTGEMSHHDVLQAKHTGHSVILCEHSNTERGYLPVLREKLMQTLGSGVNIIVSQTDDDPLHVV